MKIAILVIAVGCAGDLAEPARFTDCAPGYVEQLLQVRCGACHGTFDPDAALDLKSPGIAARLAGVPSMGTCEDRTLIEVGGADHLLLEKIEAAPSCGARMPLGSTPLTSTEIECVKRWIDTVAMEGS